MSFQLTQPSWNVLPAAYQPKKKPAHEAAFIKVQKVIEAASPSFMVLGVLAASASLASLLIPAFALSACFAIASVSFFVLGIQKMSTHAPTFDEPQRALQKRQEVGRKVEEDVHFRLRMAKELHDELFRANVLVEEDFVSYFKTDLQKQEKDWKDLISEYGIPFIQKLSLSPSETSQLLEKIFLNKLAANLDEILHEVPYQKLGMTRDKAIEAYFKIGIRRLQKIETPFDFSYKYTHFRGTFGFDNLRRHASNQDKAILRQKFLEMMPEVNAYSEDRAFLNIT